MPLVRARRKTLWPCPSDSSPHQVTATREWGRRMQVRGSWHQSGLLLDRASQLGDTCPRRDGGRSLPSPDKWHPNISPITNRWPVVSILHAIPTPPHSSTYLSLQRPSIVFSVHVDLTRAIPCEQVANLGRKSYLTSKRKPPELPRRPDHSRYTGHSLFPNLLHSPSYFSTDTMVRLPIRLCGDSYLGHPTTDREPSLTLPTRHRSKRRNSVARTPSSPRATRLVWASRSMTSRSRPRRLPRLPFLPSGSVRASALRPICPKC